MEKANATDEAYVRSIVGAKADVGGAVPERAPGAVTADDAVAGRRAVTGLAAIDRAQGPDRRHRLLLLVRSITRPPAS